MSQDPYKYFRVEAQELLEQLGKGILELEKGPPSPDLVQKLLRLAHTLKGAARVVRQTEIADRAHAIEDGLASLRGLASSIPRDQATAILGQLDEIATRVGNLSAAPPASPVPAATPSAPLDDSPRTLKADVAEMDALLDKILEVGS
ncbi:MAG: Hpt domain-containing protein, partial [Bdellovibrionota bacterium]